MKCHLVLIFFGLAAQLDSYVTLQIQESTKQSDVGEAVGQKRVARGTEESSQTSVLEDDKSEKDTEDLKVDTRRRNQQNEGSPADSNSKVLAFGLDTGAPAESKNKIVQAIYDAFGGLVERPSVRARGRGYKASDENKKPISLELKSDKILRGLENFLASTKVKKIAQDWARKAAVIYRALEKEF